MYRLLLALVLLISIGCEDEKEVNDNYVKQAILDMKLVTIMDDATVNIDGIVGLRYVGTFHYTGLMDSAQDRDGISAKALTTGCFSVPTCFRMDDTKGRAVWSRVTGDAAIYWEDGSDMWPGDIGGVTYGNSAEPNGYFPFDATSVQRNVLRTRIQNQAGNWAGYPNADGQRLGWCQEKNPHTCYQD